MVSVDPHVARPAAPSRTIQPAPVLTRTGQPGPRHICILTVALSMCPHMHDSSHHGVHDRTLGPKLMHSHRAGARPCAWPRASASPPELPRSASNWPIPHHSAPRAVQHLSSTARRRSTLDCTASLRGSSRARLSMHLSAPLHSAHGTSQYALRGSLWLGVAPTVHARAGSAHAANRQVTGFGKGRFRLSAPILLRCPRRPGCGCSAAGGGAQARPLGRT